VFDILSYHSLLAIDKQNCNGGGNATLQQNKIICFTGNDICWHASAHWLSPAAGRLCLDVASRQSLAFSYWRLRLVRWTGIV